MHRHSFIHDGLMFSYLDSGNDGRPLLALHGHFMGGSDFEAFAAQMGEDWRVIALDQRGFGDSDHTDHHSMAAYVRDAVALLDQLGIKGPVPVLGHSFGGAVAYHLAAQRPDRVSALIIEEMAVELAIEGYDPEAFVRQWEGTFQRREDLEERIGARLAPYFQDSIRRVEGGWAMNFGIEDYLLSELALEGEHWDTWLQSDMPALVIAGSDAGLYPVAHLRDMAERRQDTEFVEIKAGHSVHIDASAVFSERVRAFLENTGG